MSNQEVASGLISTLLDVEIDSIEPRPQEVIDTDFSNPLSLIEGNLRVFRLDFTAVIKLKEGGTRKVIIELQKAGKTESLLRFRNYLGSVYQGPERDEIGLPLPILAIYILGFMANPDRPALILSRNGLIDGITRDPLPKLAQKPDGANDHFFQALTHDAAFVQIPQIKNLKGITPTEQALRMFDQAFVKENRHVLVISEDLLRSGPPWLLKAFRVLQSAISNEEVQKGMTVEDNITEMIHSLEKDKEAALTRAREAMALTKEERRLKEEERALKDAAIARMQAAEKELEELRRKLEGS